MDICFKLVVKLGQYFYGAVDSSVREWIILGNRRLQCPICEKITDYHTHREGITSYQVHPENVFRISQGPYNAKIDNLS